jgi:hypothetical protein
MAVPRPVRQPHRRGRVLACMLAELPLASEQPCRVGDLGREPAGEVSRRGPASSRWTASKIRATRYLLVGSSRTAAAPTAGSSDVGSSPVTSRARSIGTRHPGPGEQPGPRDDVHDGLLVPRFVKVGWSASRIACGARAAGALNPERRPGRLVRRRDDLGKPVNSGHGRPSTAGKGRQVERGGGVRDDEPPRVSRFLPWRAALVRPADKRAAAHWGAGSELVDLQPGQGFPNGGDGWQPVAVQRGVGLQGGQRGARQPSGHGELAVGETSARSASTTSSRDGAAAGEGSVADGAAVSGARARRSTSNACALVAVAMSLRSATSAGSRPKDSGSGAGSGAMPHERAATTSRFSVARSAVPAPPLRSWRARTRPELSL